MKGLIGCIQQFETANEADPTIWAKTLDGIGNSAVDQTYNLGDKTTHAHGVGLKPDGSILFVGSMAGTFNDYVIEYPLSTNFSVSTASVSNTASDHLSIGTYEVLIGGIDFADDGSKLFTFGRTTVDRWDLSTAYDLSTGSHVSSTFSVSSQTTHMYDGYMKNDGTKMYVVGYSPDHIYEYDLSTAYALNTASFNQSFDISAKSAVTSGVHFSTDGYAFVVYDNSGDKAHKYNMTTAFDVSTASFHSSSGSFASSESTGGGIWFDDDWTYMYLVGENDDDVDRIVLAAVPAVPANLAVSTASTSQLNLSWSAASGADSYKVFRSASSGSGYSEIASGVTATSYNNTGLSQGTRYYYKIKATNDEGDSAYSTEVNAFTLPGQVTGLSASAQSNTQINLSWNNPSGTETGYQVHRATSSGGTYSSVGTPTGTTFNNTGLTQNSTYYYKVLAVNAAGNGAFSSIVNETTQNNASAPSGVSIATSSSGNYNNAVKVELTTLGSSLENPMATAPISDGSAFSSNQVTLDMYYNPDYNQALLNNNGKLHWDVRGFIRATGATSYAWNLSGPTINQDTFSALASVGTNGSPSTTQDCTGSGGIVEEIVATHNSGGRGFLLMSVSGDGFHFDVDATATNNSGSSSAAQLKIDIEIP